MKKKLGLLILLTAILFFPQKNSGAELLTNGSFETGTFTGWSTAMTQSSPWCSTWVVATSSAGCLANATPLAGTQVALNGFDGTGGEFQLWQDVAIPPAVSARLSFSFRARWNISAGSLPRTFQVQVRNTSGALLENLYTFTTNNIGGGTQDSGWITQLRWLTPYAGQTVRVYFLEVIPQSYTGPGQMEIDNIKLETFFPTAALVSIGGQVRTENGYGIPRTNVSFTDSQGQTRTATTNSFGYYSFADVEVGNTYVLQASHKQYQFTNSTQVITLDDVRKDVDFTAVQSFKGEPSQNHLR